MNEELSESIYNVLKKAMEIIAEYYENDFSDAYYTL